MFRTMPRLQGTLQLVFVVAIVGGALLLSSSLRPESGRPRPQATETSLAVTVVSPEAVEFRPSLELSGIVEAQTQTNVVPEVGGRVVQVSEQFRPGGRVAEGEVLFRIDAADYELSVRRTLADIEAARSELKQLEAESKAERQIWEREFPGRPIPDLRARVPQIAAAKARIESAEAARQAAELALERTVVRAPFAARVLETRLDVGQVVNTSQSVGTVFSLDAIEITVPVSSDDLRAIGDPYGRTVEVRTGELEASGQVVRSSAAVDERTRLATLFVRPAGDLSRRLTVGEFVSVTIAGDDAPNAVRIPTAALTSRDQVWVVDNGQLAERRVEVLGNRNGMTFVSDFDAAEGLVAVPPANGRSGLPVTPANTTSVASVGAATGGSK
jgi:RND family efflux transporter MFP subunit